MEFPDCAAAVKAGILIEVKASHVKREISMLRVKVLTVLFYAKHGKVFLLSNAVQQVNKTSPGLCPHGMSPGACPICSGMGGGSTRVGERVQKPGEMSYHECAMIGAMMKARAESIKAHEQSLKTRAEALKNFEASINNISAKILSFANNNSRHLVLKPLSYIIRLSVLPLLNYIPNLITNLSVKLAQIKEKFIDIQDKLNAIFGEAKAFIDKKVSELVSILKFKVISKIFKKNNSDNEDNKIDEDKKIFNLKTILHKIKKKIKKDDRETKPKS